jgi:CDP-diacylglycerol--serine O-phosphatidyltransferase
MHLKTRSPYGNLLTLANLITLMSLGTSVLILSRALAGDLSYLGSLFIVCLICDGADGFVARKTHTASELGTQLDSLTDAVAFGLTPVIVADAYIRSIGETPFVLAEIAFAACAVARLAMFNVQKDKSIFFGLNTPSAASMVVLLIAITNFKDLPWDPRTVTWVLNALMVVLAISMVSPFRYLSSKSLKLRMNVTTVTVGFVFIVLSIWFSPYSLYAYLIAYALSGPVASTWLLARRMGRDRPHKKNQTP